MTNKCVMKWQRSVLLQIVTYYGTLFYCACANVLNSSIMLLSRLRRAHHFHSYLPDLDIKTYLQLWWNFCIMILFALICTWIPPSLTISKVFWNTRLSISDNFKSVLKYQTFVRQQFVMGTNCSIFLYRNSFGANQRLAVTGKSFRITQVSHCGVQRV